MGQVAPIPQRPSNTDPQSIALMLALQKIMEGNRQTDARYELSRQNLADTAANRQALADENNKARLFQSQQHDKTRAEAAADRQQTDIDYKTKRDADANALKGNIADARNQILQQRNAAKDKPNADPNLLFFPSGGPTDPTLNGQDQEIQKQGYVPVGIANDPNNKGKPSVVYAKQGSVYTDPQQGQAALNNYVQNFGKASPTPNGSNTGPMQGAPLGQQSAVTPKVNNLINQDQASNPDALAGRGDLASAIERLSGVNPAQQLFDGTAAVQGKDMSSFVGRQVIPGAYNPDAIQPENMRGDVPAGPTNGNVTVVPVKPQTGANGLTVRLQSSLNDVPANLQPIVQQAADKHGVDPNVLASLLHQESGFRTGVVAPDGGQGIAQFMPATAKAYGVDPFNPASAIDGSARYLQKSLARYDGNYGLALASYNGGTGQVDDVLSGKRSAFHPGVVNYVKAVTGVPIDAWVGNKGNLTVTGNAGTAANAKDSTATSGTTPTPQQQGDPRMQQMLASAEDEDNDNLNSLDQIRALYAGSLNGMA